MEYTTLRPEAEEIAELNQVAFGGFWRRFFAALIDGILIGLIATALLRVGISVGTTFSSPGWWEGVLGWLVIPIVSVGYTVPAWVASGQTPAKKLLGIKVVSLNSTPLDWRFALLRWVGYYPTLFSALIGYLWSIWDPHKQTWHDKLAGTNVVRHSGSGQVPKSTDQVRSKQKHWGIGMLLASIVWILGVGALVTDLDQNAEPMASETEQIDDLAHKNVLISNWLSTHQNPVTAVMVDLSSLGLMSPPQYSEDPMPDRISSERIAIDSRDYRDHSGGDHSGELALRLIAVHYAGDTAYDRDQGTGMPFLKQEQALSEFYCDPSAHCEWTFLYHNRWLFMVMSFEQDSVAMRNSVIQTLSD